jgi:hypothetical protein
VSDFLQPRNGCDLGKVTIEIKGVDDLARRYLAQAVTYFDPNLGNHVYQQLNFACP